MKGRIIYIETQVVIFGILKIYDELFKKLSPRFIIALRTGNGLYYIIFTIEVMCIKIL